MAAGIPPDLFAPQFERSQLTLLAPCEERARRDRTSEESKSDEWRDCEPRHLVGAAGVFDLAGAS
jgi:hypothetical protein